MENVREVKHRGGLELVEEGVEWGLLQGTPTPRLVFAHQSGEGSDNVRKPRNKLLIKVAKS